MSIYFVTGASRGLGTEIVRAALARGHRVAATARYPEDVRAAFPDAGETLLPVRLDVTDPGQIDTAVRATVDAFGGIDVLVNNAGRGLLGAVEEATDTEARTLYDVNVFGLLAVTRAVLPLMRAAGHGTIANLSSVGGFVSVPGFGVYASTKFAVEGITEALRDELAPLGITAGVIEPGYFRTDFLDDRSLHVSAETPAYAGTPAAQTRKLAATVNHSQPGDPVKGATLIVRTIDEGLLPPRLFLGSDTVAMVTEKLTAVTAELNRQRPDAMATDHAAA